MLSHDLGRGEVNHCAVAALVTSKLFRCKQEKALKGKGSYTRKVKYKGKEPYQSSQMSISVRLFSLESNLNQSERLVSC